VPVTWIKIMQSFKITATLFFLALLSNTSFATIHANKYHDYRAQYLTIDLLKMQQFHLQQAQSKLNKGQMDYAWGDFSYMLCHVPNHHEALQQMQDIAVQLNKADEMIKFFDKAIEIFPNDATVHAMYSSFLYKSGDKANATKHETLALKLDPHLTR
jgi:Tfp pilus assembly protein PilF